MSPLNSEATKALLLEDDVLSSLGRVQSIWKSFIKDVDFDDPDNDVLSVILTSLEKNVINHLQLSDDTMDDYIRLLKKMTKDICNEIPENDLTAFLVALTCAISDYSSVNNDSADNITINMSGISEGKTNLSQLDGFKMISTMERYGILDSTCLQSLLDERNSMLVTTCKGINERWGNGSPVGTGSDADKTQGLTLKSFLPNISEVYLRARQMYIFGSMVTDVFPDTVSNMEKLIKPVDKTIETWFYRQENYLANLDNFKILDATSKYICSLFELDSSTALFTLSLVNEKIKDLVSKIGSAPSLLFSQLLVDAMLIRYLILEKGENAPDTKIAVNSLKDQIANLVNSLEDRADSIVFDDKTGINRKPKWVDDYVSYVSSAATADTVPASDKEFSDDVIDAVAKDMLSGLEDLYRDIAQNCHDILDGALESDFRSVLSSSGKPSVEQTRRDEKRAEQISAIAECGTVLHDDLNRALLDGNFEDAANIIAREIAFEQRIPNYMRCANAEYDTLKSVTECITRDIATYKDLLDGRSGGIAKYQRCAETYIGEIWKTKVPTET